MPKPTSNHTIPLEENPESLNLHSERRQTQIWSRIYPISIAATPHSKTPRERTHQIKLDGEEEREHARGGDAAAAAAARRSVREARQGREGRRVD